ncbi:MAG: acetylxylan esterase [Sandaracinaceae bacterium]
MWRLGPIVLACVAVACDGASSPDAGTDSGAPDAGPPLGPYPSVETLVPHPELPSLFTSFDGTREATTVADWEGWRRDELRDLFAFYLYGYTPADTVEVETRTLTSIPDFVPGQVDYDELELTLRDLGVTLHVSLFRPAGVTDAPVFVAPNKCGDQELTSDPRVRATTAWMADDCGADVEASRGVRSSQWPIERITASGYALAAFHESELDPDDGDRNFANGIHPLLIDEARDPRIRWGRLAAWAWGVSRVIDGLEASARIDPSRIAVVGHSRRGKTALIAGAADPRISIVIAHQSGTGGAALTRSLEGESVDSINAVFPAWFDDVFPTFGGYEDRMPIDQHMLLALIAPRALLVTDGDDDAWADPGGARMAVFAAAPAWDLYGVPSLTLDAEGAPTLEGSLSWQTRPGGHELTEADWDRFLAFAAIHF